MYRLHKLFAHKCLTFSKQIPDMPSNNYERYFSSFLFLYFSLTSPNTRIARSVPWCQAALESFQEKESMVVSLPILPPSTANMQKKCGSPYRPTDRYMFHCTPVLSNPDPHIPPSKSKILNCSNVVIKQSLLFTLFLMSFQGRPGGWTGWVERWWRATLYSSRTLVTISYVIIVIILLRNGFSYLVFSFKS